MKKLILICGLGLCFCFFGCVNNEYNYTKEYGDVVGSLIIKKTSGMRNKEVATAILPMTYDSYWVSIATVRLKDESGYEYLFNKYEDLTDENIAKRMNESFTWVNIGEDKKKEIIALLINESKNFKNKQEFFSYVYEKVNSASMY